MLMLAAIRMQPSAADSQKPLTRPPSQRQPNFKLLSFNATAMADPRSAAAKGINNADLLAHIASFMHFSSDPEQKAADDGYRLALLPSQSMLPSSRAKVLGVPSEWSPAKMVAYLIRRVAYIQRQLHDRPAGSEMPLDVRVVHGHLNAWLQRRGDEFQSSHSRVLSYKLEQVRTFARSLHKEQMEWGVADGQNLFNQAIVHLDAILRCIHHKIEADSLHRECKLFEEKSPALLEIIGAMIIGAADYEREQLRDARDRIEQIRVFAFSMKRYANGYGTAVQRLARGGMYESSARLDYYRRANEAIQSASAWLSDSENRSVPLKELFSRVR
jgi:hypothetical protein